MVISRMKTEDVTDAARIEEKIFSIYLSLAMHNT